LHDLKPAREKAFLLGIREERQGAREAEDSLDELDGLCRAMDVEPVGRLLARLRSPLPRYLLGDGKAAEVAAAVDGSGADSLIVNHPLSPAQQRNWAELCGRQVYDRQELIIRIFASRARTKEAVLQTELASLEYSLPRLSHSRVGLSRQRGGRYGTKGSGEQRLELDRRDVRARIRRIKEELEVIRKERGTMRKKRDRVPVPSCAIIGYTNAGKSSLLNAMTNADVPAEDRLFATLDPTTRRLSLGQGGDFLLTDTVGFIRDLPHNLVEAFKATLEEALDADFLLHAMDGTDPDLESRCQATRAVLTELGIEDKPVLSVFTKADLYPDEARRAALAAARADALFVSVKTREGLDELAARLRAFGARLRGLEEPSIPR
jgi:GTP-binding protein HflX